ncbi:MAG: CoA-binding protein [Promethearchaeota archaeon]
MNLNLEPFFSPKNIVIIGASRSEFTFNWMLVKNLRESRYPGKLYIIHPEADDILGVKCFRSIKELPKKPELAIVILGKNIEKAIEELGESGIKYCMIESDLSGNPDEIEILVNLRTIAEKYDILILGPAMIGITNTKNFFTSSIIPVRRHIIQKHRRYRKNGALSFLAQSGGLSGALGWWTPSQPIPIAKIIHTGKSINVSDADILQYLFDDRETSVISIYIRNPTEQFIDILRKNRGKKPVLYKMVGKNIETIKKMRTTGAVEVLSYIELFEFAKVFLWCSFPPKEVKEVGRRETFGDNIGIVGPSSGAIRLLISEMRKNGIHIAQLNSFTRNTILEKVGGSTCIDGNPVDYWPPKKFIGTDVCTVYYVSSNALLKDDKVDALFLALEFFSEIEFDFDIFSDIKKKFPNKPIIVVLIQAEKEGRERIIQAATELNIPVFIDEVERAIRAYSAFIKFYQNQNGKKRK